MGRYLLILCLFNWGSAHAFFSNTYDFGDINYVYSNSIVYESDTSAICYTTSQTNKIWTINFSRIDLRNGNILLTKKYDFHPDIIQGYYYLSLIKSKYFEGYFAAFNIGDSTFKNVQTIFFKLNSNLDTFITFRTDTSYNVIGNSIIEGPDSCLYFTGSHFFANYFDSCQTILCKFTAKGNLVFQKFYNVGPLFDGGGNLRFYSNNSIYIAGGQIMYSPILKNKINQPFILKLDKDGNLLQYKNFGLIDKDELGWALEIFDDTIYVCGKRGNPFIAKIDTNLNEIARYYIPVIQDTAQAFDIISQIDKAGNIIIAATAEKPYLKYPDGKFIKIRMGGYVGKMNRFNGEILWERMYSCNPDTEGVNYIAGLNITPSNEILIIGSGLKKVNGDYKNLDWILYLDSNGCLSNTECGEWSRVPVSSSISSQSKSSIKIFPNPLTNYCIIQQEKQSQKATYQITNMKGQMVQEGNLESDQTRIQTDLWPSGMYLIQIKREDEIYIERIVKE